MIHRSSGRNFFSIYLKTNKKTDMKTKEELNAIKEDVENVNRKLAELTDEELAVVSGGQDINYGLIRKLLEIVMSPLKEDEK